MSEIIKVASAGTMESSDAYVEISPAADVQVEPGASFDDQNRF